LERGIKGVRSKQNKIVNIALITDTYINRTIKKESFIQQVIKIEMKE